MHLNILVDIKPKESDMYLWNTCLHLSNIKKNLQCIEHVKSWPNSRGPELNKVEKLAVARPSVCVLQPGELIIYYELEESEKSSSRGIVEVCPDTHR